MGGKNNKGQILIEVSLVMLLILTIFFGAITHLNENKSIHQKYQFSKGLKR